MGLSPWQDFIRLCGVSNASHATQWHRVNRGEPVLSPVRNAGYNAQPKRKEVKWGTGSRMVGQYRRYHLIAEEESREGTVPCCSYHAKPYQEGNIIYTQG